MGSGEIGGEGGGGRRDGRDGWGEEGWEGGSSTGGRACMMCHFARLSLSLLCCSVQTKYRKMHLDMLVTYEEEIMAFNEKYPDADRLLAR